MCVLCVQAAKRLSDLKANPPSCDPTFHTSNDNMNIMEMDMLKTLCKHLDSFVRRVVAYDNGRAHVALALLCDHMHRCGVIFY